LDIRQEQQKLRKRVEIDGVTGREKRERERGEKKEVKERKEKKGRERILTLGSVWIFCDRTRVVLYVSIRISIFI
jgi:hypothetical protein